MLGTPESEDVMATPEAGAVVPEDGEQVALLISPAEEDHNTLQHLF